MSTTKSFPTAGMHCQSCARMVNLAVSDLPGIESVEVDLPGAQTVVSYDEAQVSAEQIRDAISEAGYPAQLPA